MYNFILQNNIHNYNVLLEITTFSLNNLDKIKIFIPLFTKKKQERILLVTLFYKLFFASYIQTHTHLNTHKHKKKIYIKHSK